MKTNYLLFLAILGLTVTARSQDTIPSQDTTSFQSFFGRESTEWHGEIWAYDWGWGGLLRMGSDTIVEDIQYKRIEYYDAERYLDGSYYERRDSVYDFYLREDTVAGRLWCRYPDDFFADTPSGWNGEKEALIVDMRLSIGDTFWAAERVPEFPVCIVVDTATVDHRRTISLKALGHMYPDLKFIEGVGCTNLFNYTMLNYRSIGSRVRCCHKDGELAYHSSWVNSEDECVPMMFVGINECEVSQDISIYPNPCTNKVWVKSENIKIITLCDVKGNVMKTDIDVHNSLDISNLSRGIYFLRVDTSNNVYYRTIIKN